MADAMLPYSVVVNPHFKKLMHTSQPLYMPLLALKSGQFHFLVTYGCLEAMTTLFCQSHIILSKTALKKYCVGCLSFPESPTAIAIGEKLCSSLAEWNMS
ncbi:hypothetical protein PR048_026926 [Dryococelus australis]|uniref:Uncharacterized protein n=1 Tax=Dryococelus australis TaxID=614101 RepID=A0ABQ9GMQ1_9NEOP|nr:hypothetical protein PR048_026926 [Dryococelus australis]